MWNLNRLSSVTARRLIALRDRRALAAEVAVSQAQLAIIDGVLHAATHVFDALGASATSDETALDRHRRNYSCQTEGYHMFRRTIV